MSPTYFRAEWMHDFEDEPELFHYELDDERYAIRKAEFLEDCRKVGVSEKGLERDPMALPDQLIPPPEETNGMEEFGAREITAQEFEEACSAASGDR